MQNDKPVAYASRALQGRRKQFDSGQAITKGGGSGGPPLENFEKKNAAWWHILMIF